MTRLPKDEPILNQTQFLRACRTVVLRRVSSLGLSEEQRLEVMSELPKVVAYKLEHVRPEGNNTLAFHLAYFLVTTDSAYINTLARHRSSVNYIDNINQKRP